MTQGEKDYRDLLEHRIGCLDDELRLLERRGRSTTKIYDEAAAMLEVFEAARKLMAEGDFHPFEAPVPFFQALDKATADVTYSFIGRRQGLGRVWRDVFSK